MNLDLLYIIPLYFGNDIVPKYIHFVFALLTAGLIFNYLKIRINTVYALAGALFFLLYLCRHAGHLPDFRRWIGPAPAAS